MRTNEHLLLHHAHTNHKPRSNLKLLTYLALYGNELEGVIPREMGNLKALKRLYLDSNKVSEERSDEALRIAQTTVLTS